MPSTNDRLKKPQRKKESQLNKGSEKWHEHVLSSIDPADKARLLQRTREMAKSKLGFSDSVLDKLYGK